MGSPLVIEPDMFLDTSGWSSAPSASSSSGDKSVEITEHGIRVESPAGDRFFSLTGNISHMFFGSNEYLLILTESTAAGPVQRRVSVVDFTGSPLKLQNVLDVLAPGSDVPPPIVQHSRGTGSAFLIYASDGTHLQDIAIHRSDNGDVLCSITPIDSEGDLRGEATDSEVIIHYVTGSGDHTHRCDLPRGRLIIHPPSHNFEAVVGGPPDRAIHTQEFTLDNEGNDYVIVQSIGERSPFSVTTSTPLPEDPPPDGELTVQVTFEPTALGHYEEDLPIETVPDLGSLVLACVGDALEATPRLHLSSNSFDFGRVPVEGASRSEHLYLYNEGDADLDVSWGASPPGSAFQWEGGSETILPDSDRIAITIDFDPVVSGRARATLRVESNDPESPHDDINLVGMGCLPRAEIRPPSAAPISFGEIQRGFRTVRFFTIRNTGTGRLTFRALIEGTHASLFGLQPPSGSIYDVLNSRDYSADPDPAVACGDSGEGVNVTNIAVAFHANAEPGPVGAELVICDHNASIAPDLPLPAEFRIPLQATIIEVESVDSVLVLDRSGSMGDPLGSRRKINATIESAQLFVELSRPGVGDRLAVVRYNQEANAIVPITEIEGDSTKDSISHEVNLAHLDPSGTTAIAGGILVGLQELGEPRPSPPAGELHKSLVVLTDGKDNTAYLNPGDGRWYSILGGETNRAGGGRVNTVPVSVPADVKVYGIGLGRDEDVDIARLGIISEATDTPFRVTGDLIGSTYFQLEKYFTEVYMDVASEELLLDPVYAIAPNEKHRIGFDVLRGDVQLLIVIYDHDSLRLPFHLETPKGELIEATTVPAGFQLRGGATRTARFLEVRMPQGEPNRYTGHWNAVVRHTGEACFGTPYFEPHSEGKLDPPPKQKFGFVPAEKCQDWDKPVTYGIAIGIGSNFRMRPFLTSGIVHVGDPIQLSVEITEAGLPVIACNVTVKIVSPSGRIEYITLHNDGIHDDGDAGDSDYANYFNHTGEAGSYEFSYHAEGVSRDGEPVVREATRAKYVEGRLPIGPDPRNPERILQECCRRVTWLLVASVVLLLFGTLLILIK